MSKICRKCHILLILLICGLCCFALPVAAGDNGAATCSAEQMEKIEKNLDNAAKEGLKNSKALLDAYNAAANQYVASCNANLATNTPVHWNKDAVAAAYGRDAGLAADLMGNPESAKNMYKYTGVVWSAENPTSNECKTLRGQADSALQAYNNSRTTTTALLYRAGGNKVPRACVCSENGAHQECVAFTTSDSEAKETDDTQCLTLNEYLADYAMCPLCPIFEIILNTDGKIAHISWSKIASALSKVVMAFFLVFLALETLKLVSSMGGGSTSSYLKAIFTLGLKVLITVILLQNSTYVYGYFVSPVIRGGLDMGQEFVKLGTENSVSSCHLNSANEAFATIEGHELDSSLLSDIYSTIRCFNNSAGTIPAVGRLLICQGW